MLATNGKIYLGSTLISGGGTDGWQRPADWLAIPDMATTEGFSALHAVYDTDSNFAALNVNGAYTVDWGDGTALEFYSSGSTAYHNYLYSDLPSNTETTEGYRQAVVSVLPQSGQQITQINLAVKHNQVGLVNNYSTGWLDLDINTPNISSLQIGTTSTSVRHHSLEQCFIRSIGSATSLVNLFRLCNRLQSIQILSTS
jgi:hypothetical protein